MHLSTVLAIGLNLAILPSGRVGVTAAPVPALADGVNFFPVPGEEWAAESRTKAYEEFLAKPGSKIAGLDKWPEPVPEHKIITVDDTFHQDKEPLPDQAEKRLPNDEASLGTEAPKESNPSVKCHPVQLWPPDGYMYTESGPCRWEMLDDPKVFSTCPE